MIAFPLLHSTSTFNTIETHSGYTTSVTITTDNSKIVSGSSDNTIRVWDLNTGRLLNVLEVHGRSVDKVAITPDNSKIVSRTWENTIKVWDINTGRLLNTIWGWGSASDNSIAMTSDNRKIVFGSWDNTIKVWDLEVGKCYSRDRFDIAITSIALSKNGNLIILGDSKGNLYAGTLYV